MSTRLAPVSQWSPTHARHLLNRAGFGIPYPAIAKLNAMGAEGAVAMLVDCDKHPRNIAEPDFLTSRDEVQKLRAGLRELSEDERRKKNNEIRQRQREEVNKLRMWWIDAMVRTTRPLEEKMALFWHGHFATSAEKVQLPLANYEINKVFRDHGTGNFKTLVFEVGKSPAMLEYLDNEKNRKGHPNENWARELMELFTLGIGNYTEDDIKEAARAFTGYTQKGGEFKFEEKQHDYGEKTLLGTTGPLDGADAINTIVSQPQCARFICRKLWEHFAYENPDQALVDELAETMRANKMELKPVLRQMFLSEEFHSARALNNQVKSPTQFLVGLVGQLDIKLDRGNMASLALRAMGQELFYPPNVKGWPGNRAWINTNTLLVRYNIPGYLFTGERFEYRADQRLDDERPMPPAAAERQRKLTKADRENLKRDRARAMIQKSLGLEVEKYFTAYAGRPAGEAVDGVANYFLSRPLDPAQRQVLLTALGIPEATPISKDRLDVAGISATLHLMLSTAEYQLC